MTLPLRFIVSSQVDVERVRRGARGFAVGQGLGRQETEAIVLASSELAGNLVRYARGGEIYLSAIEHHGVAGVEIESRDQGPGIPDLKMAMEDGYSTVGSMGSGLPAVRRHMDDFDITTGSQGTRIVARKWKTEG